MEEARARGLISLDESRLLSLQESGNLLFILDGFDEIQLLTRTAEPEQELKVILDKLATSRSQLIITSRKGIFEGVVPHLSGDHLHVVDVRGWDTQQWQDYLEACEANGWTYEGGHKAFFEVVEGHHRLRQLTSTPLYCLMLVETSDELVSSPNLAVLYDSYINKYLDKGKQRSFIKETAIKRSLLQATAMGMLERKTLSLSSDELSSVLNDYAQRFDNQIITAFARQDTVIYSLLVLIRRKRSHSATNHFMTSLWPSISTIQSWMACATITLGA